MQKIVVIERCCHCKYLASSFAKCESADNRYVDDVLSIPDWCPLPNAMPTEIREMKDER